MNDLREQKNVVESGGVCLRALVVSRTKVHKAAAAARHIRKDDSRVPEFFA